MSSLTRRIQRRWERQRADHEPKPQPSKPYKGGYATLTPTKGWRRFSALRLAAQNRMAHILDHVLPARKKKPAKIWRKPAPVPPSIETRQQRRYRARKGRS